MRPPPGAFADVPRAQRPPVCAVLQTPGATGFLSRPMALQERQQLARSRWLGNYCPWFAVQDMGLGWAQPQMPQHAVQLVFCATRSFQPKWVGSIAVVGHIHNTLFYMSLPVYIYNHPAPSQE